MNYIKKQVLILSFICVGITSINSQVTVTGELKQWHKVTLNIVGPQASENGTPNPFSDYKLTGIFTRGDNTYTIPGYFAADGDAANTSAQSGNIWRIHFCPTETGTWNYTIRFRSGTDVAIDNNITAGEAVTDLDNISGTIDISATDKTGRDMRGKGRLEYVGEHHLRFSGNGEWFLKAGADSPENLLDYEDFDDTPDLKNWQKDWDPHIQDWNPGDPAWQGDKGQGLIGAVNYLASRGANSISFLTLSVEGDDRSVFPWNNVSSRDNFDCSKLDQWEIVFEHAQKLGLYLHFKTSETENETLLNEGDLGRERILYYRELIARFSHHNALNWNIGEENGVDFPGHGAQTTAQQIACIEYFHDHDPYNSNIVLHTAPGTKNSIYTPLLGSNSELTGASLQTNWSAVHNDTKTWITNSANAGKKWVVSNDEQGHAQLGVPHDDYSGYPNLHNIRKQTLWGNFMAGGAGVEYYFGYGDKIDGDIHDDLIFNSSDMRGEDFRTREKSWRYAKVALDFFNQYVPFWETTGDDSKTSIGYCLYKENEMYVVYLPEGGNPIVNLGTGTYDVSWYNPRTGGDLISGNTGISGSTNIGSSPDTDNDWVALIRQPGYSHPGLPNADVSSGDRVLDIEMSETGIVLENIWDSQQLSVEFFPGSATDKTVTWSTSNRYVATVTSTGLVRATGRGEATITATSADGGYTTTCNVSVAPVAGASIVVTNNFIVFEMEATTSDLGNWVERTPDDPTYLPGNQGVDVINDQYLEFMGNTIEGGSANSPLEYKFTPTTTGEYRLAMRMRQNLETHGGAQDKANDVYIRMAGDFTSACDYTTANLQNNMKFWGRGTQLNDDTQSHWGALIRGEVSHNQYAVEYNLTAGEEYTFTISGRSKGICLDYVIFYTSLQNPGYNVDIALSLPEDHRPPEGGGNECGESIVLASETDFPNTNITGFSPAYVDGTNHCLAINAAQHKDVFAAANTIFDGESGTYDVKLTTLTETDGESTYRVVIDNQLIGEYQNPETSTDYVPSNNTWYSIPIQNGDLIQVEFNSHTNGNIPEGDGTAYSRGRWSKLTLTPVCSGILPPYVFVDSIEVANDDLELYVGQGTTISTTIYPDNATNSGITISSSDSAVATISGSTITGMNPGVAAITIASADDASINKVMMVVVTSAVVETEQIPMIEHDRSGITAIYASSENQHAANRTHLKEHTLDGDPLTKWHTEWNPTLQVHPHEIHYDFGEELLLDQIDLLPRDEGENGEIKGYEVYVSNSASNWGDAVKTGSIAYPEDPSEEELRMIRSIVLNETVSGRYLRLVATSEINDGPWASLAEIYFGAHYKALTISLEDTILDVGEYVDLFATIDPYNDTINNIISWSSTNPSVATVDANGIVSAQGGGFTYIVASTLEGYLTDSCMVGVAAEGTSLIGLLTDTLTVFRDSISTLEALTIPDGETINWESLMPSVASVDTEGHVTGMSEGETKVVASIMSELYTDTCVVNVIAPYISIPEDTIDLYVGSSYMLSTNIGPASTPASWTSSHNNIASVSAGIVVAKSEGTTTIYGSIFGDAYTDSVVVEIIQPKVTITPRSVTLFESDTTSLVAVTAPEGVVMWSSNQPEVATIDENGKVTTHAPGRALVTAQNGDYYSIGEIYVLQGATLSEENVTVYIHESYELYSTLAPVEYTVNWLSTNTGVATVSEGIISALAIGETQIVVQFINESDEVVSADTCDVTVMFPPPEVELAQTSLSLYISETFNLEPVASPDSFAISIRSTNKAIATVDAGGIVTARSAGLVQIIAEIRDYTTTVIDEAVCSVTVITPTISISETAITLLIDSTFSLSADKPDPFSVTWLSSDETIVTVSATGSVTAITEGTASIIAEIRDESGNLLASDACEVLVEDVSSINTSSDAELLLYPNPSDGIIYVNGIRGIQSIKVYDIVGNAVNFQNNTNESINLSHLDKGLYLIKLLLNNNIVVSRSIIIE